MRVTTDKAATVANELRRTFNSRRLSLAVAEMLTDLAEERDALARRVAHLESNPPNLKAELEGSWDLVRLQMEAIWAAGQWLTAEEHGELWAAREARERFKAALEKIPPIMANA
jgi:hypothetical protein